MGGLNTTQSGNTITIKTWNGLGGSFGKTGFGTVTFGTLAGGAGARLTGGNFWQGAATGLAVSWFNHYLHKQEIKSIARGILESKNINPDGTAMEHFDNVNDGESMPKANAFARLTLPDMMDSADNPDFQKKAMVANGRVSGGDPNTDGSYNKVKVIFLSSHAFRSTNLHLFMTIGHELNHVIDINFGSFQYWNKIGGNAFRHAMTETTAYQWMKSMDLNYFNNDCPGCQSVLNGYIRTIQSTPLKWN
jgi:hypothetical protein